jgi:hypothetical protein
VESPRLFCSQADVLRYEHVIVIESVLLSNTCENYADNDNFVAASPAATV